MKKYLLASLLTLISILQITTASAQGNLAPDQNPNFAVSRDKYMNLADSVNQWHGTTVQQTYKAYDWYEQKQERKNERVKFRREIRLERARNNFYYDPYYNRPYFNNYNNRYRRNGWSFWCF